MRIFILAALVLPLQAAAAERIAIAFGDKSIVAIDVAGTVVTAHDRTAQAEVTVQPGLAAALVNATSASYLLHGEGDQGGLAIIVLSEPSKKMGGTGFCGAGQEDYAVLIEKKHNVITFKARYLLQSCLRSVTVDATDPNDVRTGLQLDPAHFSWTSRRLEDAPAQKTTVRVQDGKFVTLQGKE